MNQLASTGRKSLRDYGDSILVFAFKRSATKPDTPGPSEVSPAGWTINAIPAGTSTVWGTTARKDSRGNLVEPWTPVELAGSDVLNQTSIDALKAEVPTYAPVYRGCVTTRPTSTSHKGDWILFSTSPTTWAGDAQIEVFDGATTWAVEDPPSAYHVNAATGDILKRAAFRDQGNGTYSPIKSFDFLINLFSQYIKVSGSLRVGDRYDEAGNIVDALKDGAFLSPSGMKVKGITFDGAQGNTVLNNPGGFSTANYVAGYKGLISDHGPYVAESWPTTWPASEAGSVVRPVISCVQTASPLKLKRVGQADPEYLKITGRTMSGSIGMFDLLLAPGSVVTLHNGTGLTFSYNSSTGYLTWTSPTTILRFVILSPF